MNYANRLQTLQDASGVIGAHQVGSLVPLFDNPRVHRATITYWEPDGGVIKQNTVAIIIVEQGTEQEAAYWERQTPSVLRETPVETYITDRTASTVTRAGIESFANTAWAKALSPTYTPRNIRDFDVQAVDGSTVAVSGYFNTAAGQWEHRSYYIHLVDPDGSVNPTSNNVEFERKDAVEVSV